MEYAEPEQGDGKRFLVILIYRIFLISGRLFDFRVTVGYPLVNDW